MVKSVSGNSVNASDKISPSLAGRLNLNVTGSLFGVVIFINVLLIIISSIIVLRQAETGVVDVIKRTDDIRQYDMFDKYRVISAEEPELFSGFAFPGFVQKWLSDKDEQIHEIGFVNVENDVNISGESDQERLSGWKRVKTLGYSVATIISGQKYRVIYMIGQDIWVLMQAFAVILIIELIVLLQEIFGNLRMIRKNLRPLYDLAESARNLQSEVSTYGAKMEERQLRDLAGELSDIDANRLDKIISVDGKQEELKGLASAINDMLRRIHDAYQSQVQFVSDASHELRTPISVIQGYANLLDRWGKNDPQTMQESIDAIKAETQNMKELVEQLLFLARGDNETIQLHLENFDVNEICAEIVREAKMIDNEHQYEIELQTPASIYADKQLIKQAIRILIDNSVKYTPAQGRIALKTVVSSDAVSITVQDTGIGIEPASLPQIFNRFYRSDESRTRKTGGSGLGLAIAQWIARRHGAHFEILSRVGIGTRISIVMPNSLT